MVWVLQALRPTASSAQRLEALREVKRLVRSEDDAFWALNCGQVVSVLLENFNPPARADAAMAPAVFVGPDGTPLDKDALAVRLLPLTGYTPQPLQADLDAEGEENRRGAENMSSHQQYLQQSPREKGLDASTATADSMHMACKVLLLLAKFRGQHVKVRRCLCHSRLQKRKHLHHAPPR